MPNVRGKFEKVYSECWGCTCKQSGQEVFNEKATSEAGNSHKDMRC